MTLIQRASFCAVLTLFLSALASGTTENTAYTFGSAGGGDGMYPFCSPVFDAQGNLYGTTLQGGTHNAGNIFELSPGQNGQWTETVIYEFTGGKDGGYPIAGLVFGSDGNLYGTGEYGGANGTGVTFELSRDGEGWEYNVLYNFGPYPGSDGFGPNSIVVFDKLGNLYGTTSEGGNVGCFEGCGTVFELSPNGKGGWDEQVIHAFETNGIDGELPAGITLATDDTLYGTTQNGGTAGSGVLYQLKYSSKKKQWIEAIVHQFIGGSNDGAFPESPVSIHGSTLYGTTEGGGTASGGTVFETILSNKKGWPTTVLYSFDGALPQAGLIMEKGNLYGTTFEGGSYGAGDVFELSKLKNGDWAETTLYSFTGGEDGLYPEAAVTLENGWLYGTTRLGGNNSGVVFQVHPN
jgi:uncharacterized repeat protein (TIGR03803 family)